MVKVRLFAAAASAAGARALSGDWDGLTAAQVLDLIIREYPRLAPMRQTITLAVNHEYVGPDHTLQNGDELALIPPVSGGAQSLFEVVETPLNVDAIQAKVIDPSIGAVVHFVGTVREWTRGRQTVRLEYEAYPEMAVAQMEVIAREIGAQWEGARVAISHRVGNLAIGEVSVVIAVATPHRGDAFAACRHAIERLKQIVPIWKKEVWADGEEWAGSQAGPDWMHPELNG